MFKGAQLFGAKIQAAVCLAGGTFLYSRQRQGDSQAEGRFPFFEIGVINNPHFEKRYKGGEDGWSVSQDQRFIMVCDGVGGWAKKSVDPGLFAKHLANKVRDFYEADPKRDLKDSLISAVKVNPHRGSSTAVSAKLEADSLTAKSANLKTCNLGDSGYLIVRPNDEGSDVSKVFRSTEHQHYFNCPHQCGENHELPYKAVQDEHTLNHNDIVVMGSDGVFDNLTDEMIVKECLIPNLKRGGNLANINSAAGCISAYAEFKGYDENYESPFCKSAVAHGKKKERYIGGKSDDITVIVGQLKTHERL